jgi:hypothetical protein
LPVPLVLRGSSKLAAISRSVEWALLVRAKVRGKGVVVSDELDEGSKGSGV